MNQHTPAISKGIDWSVVWIYFLLVAIGIMAIFGATYVEGDPVLQSFFGFKTDYSKQLYFFIVALGIGLLILLTDSKFFPATANIWYVAGLVLLLLVFPFHSKVKEQNRSSGWVAFNFSPQNFVKYVLHWHWRSTCHDQKQILPKHVRT